MNNMVKNIFKSRGFWLIMAILCLAIVGSLFSFMRWQESHYFGKVLSVGSGSFVVQDPHVGTRTFLITDNTYVGKGRTRLDAPNVGDEVLIVGEKTQNNQIEALGVRVVDPKFKKKK